jgi:hypothetical protein
MIQGYVGARHITQNLSKSLSASRNFEFDLACITKLNC